MKTKQIEFPGINGSVLYKLSPGGASGTSDLAWDEVNKRLSVNGSLSSNDYRLGSDLQMVPVVGGQSVLRSYWGLQLGGMRASEMSVEPLAAQNINDINRYSVLIASGESHPSSFGNVGTTTPFTVTGIFKRTWQTNGFYLECVELGTNTVRAAIDFAGNYRGTTYTASGFVTIGSYTVANLPTNAPNGAIAIATNGRRASQVAGAGTGVLAIRMNSQWVRSSDYTVVVA